MRKTWVAFVADDPERRHAGIQRKPFRGEDVECPERTLVDGPLGCTEKVDVRNAGFPEHRYTGAEIVQETVRAEIKCPLMCVSVRSDLVPRVAHVLDQPRMAFGHPPDDEECGANASGVEQVQHTPRCRFDSGRQAIPLVERQWPAHPADVKPFFEVDGEDVGDNAVPCLSSWKAGVRKTRLFCA